MDLRALGLGAGLSGALCWAVIWAVSRAGDVVGDPPGWGDPVRWVGPALLGVALAAAGSGLVSRSAPWLRAIVALALPLLAWSVYTVLRGTGDDPALDGVVGLAVVCAVVAVMAARRRAAPQVVRGGRHGSHAAR
jgi:hypothetical protein